MNDASPAVEEQEVPTSLDTATPTNANTAPMSSFNTKPLGVLEENVALKDDESPAMMMMTETTKETIQVGGAENPFPAEAPSASVPLDTSAISEDDAPPVSYTHLTLPTIYSV